MSSSTSGPRSSDRDLAVDREQLSVAERRAVFGPGLAKLWIGIAGGPAVWFADLQTAYLLAYYACHAHSRVPLMVETLVALGLATACVIVAWRQMRHFSEASEEGGQPDDRARFMGIAGVALSGIALLTIVAATIPRFVLSPCPG